MTERIAGRYRPVAPLPTLGGVQRELAVDEVADHRVAVACLVAGDKVGAVELLLRTFQALRHASLAPVLDVVSLGDGTVFQVEAQADGPLLDSAVMMPQASVLLVVADIADALGVLHASGQTHGGLVDSAVVLDASGRPVVMGVGLGVAHALVSGLPTPTVSDDMRALGAILYRLVTGHEPSQPATAPASLSAAIAPALNGLILALLSDDARQPPPPAVLVAERLRAMAGVDLPATLVPAPLKQPPLPMMPRRGISDAALAAIVGAIALLAIVLAIAAVNGSDFFDDGDSTASLDVPTFTLPEPDSLTLTVTGGDELPLPGVVTDSMIVPTDTMPVDSFEVFTDTVATVPETIDTTGVTTISG